MRILDPHALLITAAATCLLLLGTPHVHADKSDALRRASAPNSPQTYWSHWSLDACSKSKNSRRCKQLKRDEHRVGPLPWEDGQEPIEESFAGHIPIRPWSQDGYHGETSMFYWFFPAIKPKAISPPLLIWLQGGPGSSSMIGLFFENGPIRVTKDMKLTRAPTSWADEYSVLFIDQPVGTGYSYVTNIDNETGQPVKDEGTLQDLLIKLNKELDEDEKAEAAIFEALGDKPLQFKADALRMDKNQQESPLHWHGYVKDQRGVAADLIQFLDKFYDRYPEQKDVDLYLTGESYAGKYVPSFAHAIMERNLDELNTHNQYPLKGIALGNSLTDPVSQVNIHADHAYFLGLVDNKQAEQMREFQKLSIQEIHKGRFVTALEQRLTVFDLFKNATGGLNWYDIRKGDVPNDWSTMETFMNLKPVKDSLNVFGPRSSFLEEHGVSADEIERIEKGRALTEYFKDPLVLNTLYADIMKSTAWMVSDLLKYGIRVVAYQGVYDFRDAVAGSTAWINSLEWSGQNEFLEAERKVWMVDGKLAGFVTSVPGLSRVVLLGAGHLAPMDQGEAAFAMIKAFVENTDLSTESPSQHRATHTI
ncbi:hypothetical protein BG004_001950 [Podila humilis]|nr:hypothetical protein BG004_001950 [Podila humilis]